MALNLTPDELRRARKIAAMLSASTDGERLAALAKLTEMATSKKLRVDELLVALGDPSRPPSPGQNPNPRQPPWWGPNPGREGGDYTYTDASYTDKSTYAGDRAFAEMLRQEQLRREAQARAKAEAVRKANEEAAAHRKASADASLQARLAALFDIDDDRLSPWENDFISSIELQSKRGPFWRPSEKQDAIINKILQKNIGG